MVGILGKSKYLKWYSTNRLVVQCRTGYQAVKRPLNKSQGIRSSGQFMFLEESYHTSKYAEFYNKIDPRRCDLSKAILLIGVLMAGSWVPTRVLEN